MPHENSNIPYHSREFLKACKYIIAEVSYPSTGLGIELGWSDIYGVPIIALVKKGHKIPGSINVLTNIIIVYENSTDLVDKLSRHINKKN